MYSDLIYDPNIKLEYEKFGKLKSSLKYLIGIPTVAREKESYITDTIDSIFEQQSFRSYQVAIMVFIGGGNQKYFTELSKEFGFKYKNQIEAGLLQIVAIKLEYYPDYLKNGVGSKESLKLLWGDDMKRTLWRTKQALDYIYLWKIAGDFETSKIFHVSL